MIARCFTLCLFVLMAISCAQKPTEVLPYLGRIQVQNGDTTYHRIAPFSFIDQDSNVITNETFRGKAYVADFFFTSCPTICPIVKGQTKRIHEAFYDEEHFLLLSHSIDTRRDSVPVLKAYSERLGITGKWHFVTGARDDIYSINEDYFIAVVENPDAPGGFDHSGKLILVDGEGHVRSFCEGTDPKAVDGFMDDIHTLLLEMDNE